MLQVGSSWTTLPTTLPATAACASSVVYDNNKLVVLGAGNETKHARESGTVLCLSDKNTFKVQASLPGLGGGNTGVSKYLYIPTADVLSSASSAVLLNNRFLYAVVCNDTNSNTNSHSKHYKNPSKKNIHGYTPQEELYVADLKEYMSKGVWQKAMDFIGGFTCAMGLSSSVQQNKAASNNIFWNPVVEMEDIGASMCGSRNILCAVGGFQTLSPKFYQVFSAKERVSLAARMLVLPDTTTTTTPTSDTWFRLPDMNVRRKNLCTIIVGNYLYALGGQDESGKALASVERLNLSLVPSASSNLASNENSESGIAAWEPVASMNTARYGFSATTTTTTTTTATGNGAHSIIVVAGGFNDASGRLDSVECFVHSVDDNSSNHDNHHAVWKKLPSMQTPRMGASLSIINSKLVIAGGTKTPGPFWGSGALDTIETLDIVVPVVDDPVPAILAHATVLPQAQAEVMFDETGDGGDFVSIIPTIAMESSNAPPTAPAHNTQQQKQQYAPPIASLPAQMQPSAPTLEEVYHVEEPDLPSPLPPPYLPTEDEELLTDPIIASALPPPLLPPSTAAAAESRVQQQLQQDDCTSDDDISCAICLERKKQVAFLCGHQACLQCSPLVDECHICRKPIQGRIQLYGD